MCQQNFQNYPRKVIHTEEEGKKRGMRSAECGIGEGEWERGEWECGMENGELRNAEWRMGNGGRKSVAGTAAG